MKKQNLTHKQKNSVNSIIQSPMTGQIVTRSTVTAPTHRHQPLLNGTQTPSSKRRSTKKDAAEIAGKTTANCFLVFCCGPCVVVEFIILAVYRVPASICRRIWRKRSSMVKRRKRELSGGGEVYYKTGYYFDEAREFDERMLEIVKVSFDGERSTVDLDLKMWDQFHSAGFWRSSSQRSS